MCNNNTCAETGRRSKAKDGAGGGRLRKNIVAVWVCARTWCVRIRNNSGLLFCFDFFSLVGFSGRAAAAVAVRVDRI